MLKNIGSNWALSFVQILIFLVLVPFVLDALGPDRNGVWEVIINASGPLQLLALGMPMATVRHVAKAVADGKPEEAERVVGNSLSLSLLLGLLALLIGVGIYQLAYDKIIGSDRWNLPPDQLADATRALVGMLILVGTSFSLRLPYAVYDAHHDFVVRNVIQVSGFLLRFGLTLALLTWNASLTVLAGILIFVAVVECIAAIIISAKRHNPIRIRPRKIESAMIKKLLSFGIFAFLMNMGALFAFQLDALVIGGHMDPVDVTDYTMGNKIFEQFITLVLAIGMVAMPMATDLFAKGDEAGVRQVFLKWSKIALSLVLLVGGYLIVMGPEFLQVWFTDDYTAPMGKVMQILMLSFFFFLPMRGVALPILMGMGKTKGPGFGLLAMGVTNLAISLALVGPYGIYGVALGTAIPNVVFACIFLGLACHHTGVSISEFMNYTVVRSLVGVLPAIGLLAAIKYGIGVESLVPVVGCGVLYTFVFLALQLFFVYRNDALTDPLALIQRKLAR